MSKHLLVAALALAYGPFLLMGLLYLAGLALRLGGRFGLLQWLIRRTQVPPAVQRDEADGIIH